MISKGLQRKINRVRRRCNRTKEPQVVFYRNGCKYEFGRQVNTCFLWVSELCEWRVVEERE